MPPYELQFRNLEAVLEDEVKLYRLLLDLARREKDFLITADVKALEENNTSKEQVLFRIRDVDAEREKLAIELAAVVGAAVARPRLLEIALKLTFQDGEKLRAVHSTLGILVSRIEEINEANQRLIEDGLKTINGALGVIRDSVGGTKPTYGQKADIKQPEGAASGHFVSKEA